LILSADLFEVMLLKPFLKLSGQNKVNLGIYNTKEGG